ncbi:TPA: ribosomal RNA small subunit methyltransferase A, partial [bacterium]|nr:ribosomal RNA small subunit methyltransferase A [bacterium]
MLFEETTSILKKYNIKPKKDLSQNFLIDNWVFQRIIDELQPNNDDTVFEIGSGIGVITKYIAPLVKKIIACEIDPNFAKIIEEGAPENLEVINEDILKLDLSFLPEKTKVIGNIPYHITTSTIMHLLLKSHIFSFIILTIQYDVGKRIIAQKGKEYGILSVVTQIWTKPKIVMKIPPSSFLPMPKPFSCLIRLDINKKSLVRPNPFFFEIVDTLFSQRRRKIINSLSSLITKKNASIILENANIDSSLRPESLSIFDFERIANEYTLFKTKSQIPQLS